MQNQNVRLLIALVLGILIGLGSFWLWGNRSNSMNQLAPEGLLDTTTAASSTAVEEGDGGLTGSGPAVKIEDQNPGRLVVVYQVSLTKPGWVVIRDNNNGQVGNILGARLFDSGKNSGLIPLLRATVVDKKYFAVLHNDNGDNIFDPKKDLPIKDSKGIEIMSPFSVSVGSDKPQ
jgi:hypothetical protein